MSPLCKIKIILSSIAELLEGCGALTLTHSHSSTSSLELESNNSQQGLRAEKLVSPLAEAVNTSAILLTRWAEHNFGPETAF